jgi:O-antigen/teichoic acid export membrane protein
MPAREATRKLGNQLGQFQRNTIYNIVGSIVPTISTIICIPYYLETLGVANYGVYVIVILIFGYTGVFDIGLARATTNQLAKLSPLDFNQVSRFVQTAIQVSAVSGMLFGAFVYVVYMVALQIYGGSWGLAADAAAIIGLTVSMCVPTVTTWAAATGAIDARGRFLESNILQVSASVLVQVAPLVYVTISKGGITDVIFALGVVRYFMVLVALLSVRKIFSISKLHVIDTKVARSLIKYGVSVAMGNAFGPLLSTGDQLVVSAAFGTHALAPYSIASSVVGKILVLPASILRARFPEMSRVSRGEAYILASHTFNVMATVSGVIAIFAAILVPTVMPLWLGGEVGALVTVYALPLLFGVWINSLAFIPYSLLQAIGRPGIVTRMQAIEFIPFIGILYLSTSLMGMQVVPYVWVARVGFDCVLLFWVSGLSWVLWRAALPVGFLLIFSVVASSMLTDISTRTAVGIGVLCVGAVLASGTLWLKRKS